MSVPVTFRLPDGTPEGEETSSRVEQRNGREKATLKIRPSGKILLNGDVTSLDHLTEQILREVPDPENSTLTIKVDSEAPQRLKNEVIQELRKIDMAKGSPKSRDIRW
jgi:biopolymer transport protein ExbD